MRTKQFRHSSTDWLFDSQLAPYVDAFKHHLAKGQYAPTPSLPTLLALHILHTG
jgi:hypothetical protein